MSDEQLIISERIEPTLIPALFKNFDNAEIAILELLDNAIDDRIEGKTLEISIDINNYSVIITNKGGYGMGLEDLGEFFAWGKSNKKNQIRRLGRYGQGGKAAMGYLAKSCQISTTKRGDDKEYIVRIDNWSERKKGYVNAEVKVRDSDEIEQGLVIFSLWGLNRQLSTISLAKALSETYAPLLREEQIKMWLNNNQILGVEIPYEESPTKISFEILPGSGKCVTADIGLISYKKGLRGGFRCYEFNRLIATGEYFGQKTREDKYAFEKLAGEVFIEFDIPLIMNKTNFDRSSESWRTLTEIMYNKLEPWIKRLSSSTRKEPSKVELSHQRNVNAAFEDFRIRQREKTLEVDKSWETPEDSLSYNDLIPDYAVEFRSLDQSLRYQVITEDGKKKVLINLSYPAYKIWQKDMDLYIVDILVQELARQQSEDIEDFLKKFSRIFIDLSQSFKK